jgi:GDPmannose 4,6-dehydratase
MAYWSTVNYREAYGLHASNGILFNHESPRRGETFVTRKITRAVAKIANGSKAKLLLGNLEAVRDWGFAKEYVESMWMMLQQEHPSDYVVATGVGATVKDFARVAFEHVGLNYRDHIEVSQRYERPTEVESLIGDPSKVSRILGWKAKTNWEDLAKLMVDADYDQLTNKFNQTI